MKRLVRIVSVLLVVAFGAVVAAPSAGAKVLPYQMELVSTDHTAGQPVQVVVYLHPQNVLPSQFRFQVRRFNVKRLQQIRRLGRIPGRGVLMKQVGEHEYRGSFTPKNQGLYALYDRGTSQERQDAGYPAPILFFWYP